MTQIYPQSFFAMNTRCNLIFPGLEEKKADHIANELKNETLRIEQILSRFISESEISTINKLAFKQPMKVSDEVFNLLKECQKYHEVSQGAFDVTLYPLMEYWKESQTHQKPLQNFEELSANVGMENVTLNEIKKTISFKNKCIELDLGAVGKGYALKKMNQLLKNFSIANAFVSFGESSVLALGNHPAGDCWKVGPNNYLNPGTALHTFDITNGSMSTSSNFYIDDKGNIQNHWHVINPLTKKPVEAFSTASVKASSPVLAEIISTAALVSSEENIVRIKDQVDDIEIVKINYGTEKPEITTF